MILPSKINHVYHVDDIKEHHLWSDFRAGQLPSCKCECHPEHKELCPDESGEPTAMVIVHNSFDGREGVEWANEILCP
jgi:hypothetical protein